LADDKWNGVSARCSLALSGAIEKEVKRSGKRRQKVITEAIEKGLGISAPSIDAKPMIEELKALRLTLVPIGGNMNQVAHAFNSQQYLNRDDLKTNHEKITLELKKIIISIRGIERELYRRSR
jgi:hypothetical protein